MDAFVPATTCIFCGSSEEVVITWRQMPFGDAPEYLCHECDRTWDDEPLNQHENASPLGHNYSYERWVAAGRPTYQQLKEQRAS